MKIKARIKMGFKKIFLIVLLVFCLRSTVNGNLIIRTEVFEFNKSIGMTASATVLEEEKPEVKETPIIDSPSLSTKTGNMTAYSADCKACSGRLACSSYKVYKNNVVTYPDATYGDVRIVASSKNLACGSIIRISTNKVFSTPTYAIVLDRGVRGNNIDLLVQNESIAINNVGRVSVAYDVVRNGW